MKENLFLSLLCEAWWTSWEVIRITVPVAVITRILAEFGLIDKISQLLEPVMALIGLPGELGVVWATAMLTHLYAAVAVFASLAPGLDLTQAQLTIICSAMLLAHGLPLELSITKRAGVSVLYIGLLRFLGAILYCFLLNLLCSSLDIWQQVPELIFKSAPASDHLTGWLFGLLSNLAMIFVILFGIVLVMRVLRGLGVLKLLEKVLGPFLPPLGMGQQAAPLTVVGMIMGLAYGGALIIRESVTRNLPKKDIINSMALLGLCHSLVEDTLIMVALGGNLVGIFWGRIVFSLLVVYLLVRLSMFFRYVVTARS